MQLRPRKCLMCGKSFIPRAVTNIHCKEHAQKTNYKSWRKQEAEKAGEKTDSGEPVVIETVGDALKIVRSIRKQLKGEKGRTLVMTPEQWDLIKIRAKGNKSLLL